MALHPSHAYAMEMPRRFEYTDEIDRRILELVRQHGKKWRLIAGELGGVITEDAVRNRYMRVNDHTPKPLSARCARCVMQCSPRKYWTEKEDMRLARAIEKYGTKWNIIHDVEFPDKTRQAIRNRAQRMTFQLLYLMSSIENI